MPAQRRRAGPAALRRHLIMCWSALSTLRPPGSAAGSSQEGDARAGERGARWSTLASTFAAALLVRSTPGAARFKWQAEAVCVSVLRSAAAAEAEPGSQAHAQFSLGGALFGLTPARGHVSPQQQAPGSWVILFEKHAGQAAYNGLFTSCRKGRDWVLQDASQIAIKLDTRAEQGGGYHQLRAVRRALETRGVLPARLVAVTSCNASSLAACQRLFRGLRGACAGLGTLKIQVMAPVAEKRAQSALEGVLSRTVAAIAAAVRRPPAEITLSKVLPQPAHFPSVRELVISGETCLSDHALQHLATFIPQLTTLRVQQPTYTGLWPAVFSPASASRTLTCLSTGGTLTDELLGLLLEHAPALQSVEVHTVDVRSWQYRNREWRVQTLACGHAIVRPCHLSPLPRTPAALGVVEVVVAPVAKDDKYGTVHFWGVNEHTFMHDSDVEQLSRWHFRAASVHFPQPSYHTHPSDQRTALARGLSQLAALNAPGAIVHINGWDWTATMAQTLASALRTEPLSRVSVAVDFDGPLTDELLGIAGHMGPNVCRLAVTWVALRGDHSREAWPWSDAQLHVDMLDLADAVKLPACAMGRVHVDTMRINEDAMKEAGVLRAAAWLQRGIAPGARIVLPCSILDTQVTDGMNSLTLNSIGLNALRAKLAFMRSITCTSPRVPSVHIVLSNWPVAHDTMALLRGLPQWSGALHFVTAESRCAWPLPPHAYEQLAACVPTSYTAWHVTAPMRSRLLKSICAGVERVRQGFEPLEIRVWGYKGEDVRVGQRVVLKAGPV